MHKPLLNFITNISDDECNVHIHTFLFFGRHRTTRDFQCDISTRLFTARSVFSLSLSLPYIIVSTAAHTVHCTYARQDKRALKQEVFPLCTEGVHGPRRLKLTHKTTHTQSKSCRVKEKQTGAWKERQLIHTAPTSARYSHEMHRFRRSCFSSTHFDVHLRNKFHLL